MIRRYAIVFLIITGLAGIGSGQVQYSFNQLDISNGLSHNRVNCIFKDSRGFMWFGTLSGLNRFDGYAMKVFKQVLHDSATISDNDIIRIAEDEKGRLWITNGNRLNIYDPTKESFDRNPIPYLLEYAVPESSISSLYKDRSGNLWFVGNHTGMYRYDVVTGKTAKYVHLPSDTASLYSNDVSAVSMDKNGDLWIVSQQGVLEKMDIRTGRIQTRFFLPNVKNTANLQSYNLYIDLDGDLWIYFTAEQKGIFYFDTKRNAIRHFHRGSSKSDLNNEIVNGVVQDDSRKIWIVTDHGGVNLFDKKTNSFRYILNNPGDEKSLIQNSITTIYKDSSGIIWMGTFKKGVCFYNENITKFKTIKSQGENSTSLGFDDVNCFAEDKKGNLWIGTNGGGLIYFDRAGNTFRTYLHNPSDPASLSSNIIVCLWIDRQQKLWIGTYFGGLNSFDGSRFVRYQHVQADRKSIADDRIWAILEDSQDNLWIGTLGGGLELYDREKKEFYHYRTGMTNSVRSDFISSLTEDREGNIWVGTANGVDVLKKQTRQFTHYGHDARDPKSLSHDNVYSIYEDSRDNIWVGTRIGLNLLNKKTGKFRIIRTENGLPDNTVFTVLEDSRRNMWVSTANGLSNIEIRDTARLAENLQDKYVLTFKNYNESDGLQGREFNDKAGFKTREGEIIFGGADGFNIIVPEQINLNAQIPNIVFTDFQIFNQSVLISKDYRGRSILTKALNETKHITLKYSENVFSIEFAALSYFHPEKNQYRYILHGFNKEWLSTGSELRKATFTNLNPGDYRFQVIASNNDGYWNETGISVDITVLPPWWRSQLAFAVYFLLVAGIILLSRKMLLDRARIRFKLEQEHLEAQRIRELDLLKTKFFTNVSHEFRTPLALITAPLEKISKTLHDPEQKKQVSMIQINAKRLLNLVNQLLDFRRLEVQEFKYNPSYGDIVGFIKEISYSFSDIAEKKHIRFSVNCELTRLDTSFDEDKLEKILFNLLSNAFKFTLENGIIDVEVTLLNPDEDRQLQIQVKDNGIGIDPGKQDKIFERFFQVDGQGTIINQGSGIGLSLTREFVKIHGGSISFESQPGQGSCFTVVLPLTRPEVHTETEIAAADEKGHLLGAKKPLLLLVEDNEDFRFYLKDNLGQRFSIIEAANGQAGCEQALRYFPNLIVSDIIMPVMDGIGLCMQLKQDKRTSHIPIILLTSRASEEQRVEGFKAGADDYITKPFSFEILEIRILNLITERENLKKLFHKQIEIVPSEISITSMDEKLIQKALDTVEKNISNPDFSVEELSRVLGMSRVHLYKKLLSLTGKSPIEFIRSVRLKRAAQLILKSQLRISEIAYQVGFNNPKYFSRYFKQEFGILPSEYLDSIRVPDKN